MPLPTSAAILLTVASIGLIVHRILRPARNHWGLICLTGILLSAGSLLVELAQQGTSTVAGLSPAVWATDSLATAEQWVVIVLGVLSALAAFHSTRIQPDCHEAPGYVLFALAGLMLCACSNDLIVLGLSLEVVSLAVIGMTVRHKSSSACDSFWESSHVWYAAFASGSFWLGIALFANGLATTHFDQIQSLLRESYAPGNTHDAVGTPSRLLLLATGLIVISLLSRMGLAPFQFALNSLARHDSIWIAGFSMLTGYLAGAIVFNRLLGLVLIGIGQMLFPLLLTLSLSTFAIASVIAVRGFSPGVKSVRVWLQGLMLFEGAASCIGLMTIAAELEQPAVRWGAVFPGHEMLSVMIYGQITTILAFSGIYFVLAHLSEDQRGVDFIEELKGLARISWLAALTLTVCLTSVIGCPLTAGFWNRWLILLGGANVHGKWTSSIFSPQAGLRFLMLVEVLTLMIFAAVAIKIGKEVWLERPLGRPTSKTSRSLLLGAVTAAIATLVLGVAPQLVLIPLRNMPAPRAVAPEAPQRGSGRNSLGWNGFHRTLPTNSVADQSSSSA